MGAAGAGLLGSGLSRAGRETPKRTRRCLLIRAYPHVEERDIRVLLIERKDRLLSNSRPQFGAAALKQATSLARSWRTSRSGRRNSASSPSELPDPAAPSAISFKLVGRHGCFTTWPAR